MCIQKQLLAVLFSFLFCMDVASQSAIHTWEMQELTFEAENSYANPYVDVILWINLSGPEFSEKVYGFWDGGNTFKVRFVATQPGPWTWESFCNTNDPGLSQKQGSLTAIDWTEAEKQENPTRRGFLRPTANQHA